MAKPVWQSQYVKNHHQRNIGFSRGLERVTNFGFVTISTALHSFFFHIKLFANSIFQISVSQKVSRFYQN